MLERVSPDGTIRVDLAPLEWSNANWANAPRVIALASGRVLLDLWGSDWDAAVFFDRPGQVRLDCRRLHIGGRLSVVIDVARDRYRITLDPELGGALPEQPIDSLAPALDAASLVEAQRIGGRGTGFAVPPNSLTAWRAALLILVIALLVIAAVPLL